MTRHLVSITIEVEVGDEDALKAAAEARYLEENTGDSLDQWHTMRDDYPQGPVAADVLMVFDPGVSPPGCEIQCSEANHLAWE
jgi:hypothetical protein